MGAKKKDSKVLAKSRKLEAQNRKANKKAGKKIGDTVLPDDDIDAIFASIKEEEAKRQVVMKTSIIESCPPMGPRAHCSVTMLSNGAEAVIYGGEYYNGANLSCYGELYRLNLAKLEQLDQANEGETGWRTVIPPMGPRPRCSHQAFIFQNSLYVFGGEFATKDQFRHYNDLWMLDTKSWLWKELKTSGKPPTPRSGHRMVVFRGHVILFGGFHDNFREVRYFNDLYSMSLSTLKWQNHSFKQGESQPLPRSSFIFAAFENLGGIYLYGGYQKIKDRGVVHSDSWWLNLADLVKGHRPTWETVVKKGVYPVGRSSFGYCVHKQSVFVFGGVRDEDQYNAMRSFFFNDLYCFDATKRRWYQLSVAQSKQKIKSIKAKPSALVAADNVEIEAPVQEEPDDEDEMTMDPRGYDDDHDVVYIDNGNGELVPMRLNEADEFVSIETEAIKQRRKEARRKLAEESSSSEPEGEGEEEDMESQRRMIRGKMRKIKKRTKHVKNERDDSLEGDSEGKESIVPAVPDRASANVVAIQTLVRDRGVMAKDMIGSLLNDNKPCPRINPCCVVRGSHLYVIGGLVEVGHREVTLDDIWALNVVRRDGWRRVASGAVQTQVWQDQNVAEEDEDEDDDEDFLDFSSDASSEEDSSDSVMSTDSEDRDETEEESVRVDRKNKARDVRRKEKKRLRNLNLRDKIALLQKQLPADKERVPEVGESLKAFNKRTLHVWLKDAGSCAVDRGYALDDKELRREAFKFAHQAFYEVRQVLEELHHLSEKSKANDDNTRARK